MARSPILKASVARARFTKIIGEAARGKVIRIQHREKGNAVLVSEREYESCQAARRMLRDPELMREIEERRKTPRSEFITHEQWRRDVGLAG